MDKKTLEEAYLNKLIEDANKEFTLDKKLAKEVAIKFSKWQQEKMYSEEVLIDIIQFLSMNKSFNNYSSVNKETAKYFLEQFKKEIGYEHTSRF